MCLRRMCRGRVGYTKCVSDVCVEVEGGEGGYTECVSDVCVEVEGGGGGYTKCVSDVCVEVKGVIPNVSPTYV